MNEEEALRLAESAYKASTTWIDSSLRMEWERNEAQFQGRHPSGSKYHSDSYKYRSKHFRPKTRSTIQSNEADCAFAFFSTNRMVDIGAVNDASPLQRASAEVMQKILDYRLEWSIPWFKIVVGGWQDTLKHGVCIGHAYWDFREVVEDVAAVQMDPLTGEPVPVVAQRVEVVKDCPHVEIIPVENFRVDPAADWTDPVNSSPYVIRMIPMFVEDVLQRMETVDPKTGQPKWRKLEKKDLLAAGSDEETDTTRSERWGRNKEDPFNKVSKGGDDFTTVWIHQNFIRHNGEDWMYYTAGSTKLLTEPRPVTEAYGHLRKWERPFVFGNCSIEAHKAYPGGVAALLSDPQKELNDSVNLRMDLQKMSLTPPVLVKRTANMDYDAMRKRIPGAGVLTDNPQTDAQFMPVPHVDAAAYQEEDRLSAAFDDLSGAFAWSTVNTNRNLNQTVGGMNLLSASSSKIADYRIMIFAKTFVKPQLGQIIRLEQAYETDLTVLGVAAQQAKLFQKYGMNAVTDEMMRQQLMVRVNVGISSTNPVNKMNLFERFVGSIVQLAGPRAPEIINLREIIIEAAGILGYQDGFRFFQNTEQGDDPRIAAYEAELRKMGEIIKTKQIEEQSRNARMQELQDKKDAASLEKERMKSATTLAAEQMRISHEQGMHRADTAMSLLGELGARSGRGAPE